MDQITISRLSLKVWAQGKQFFLTRINQRPRGTKLPERLKSPRQ